MKNKGNYVISLPEMNRWLAEQAEDIGWEFVLGSLQLTCFILIVAKLPHLLPMVFRYSKIWVEEGELRAGAENSRKCIFAS